MATITVNGRDIEIGDDERLNCIQAADRADVKVPYYCWHPGLTVVASCRMCLVETGTRGDDGKVQMAPKLNPACQTPAKHGTVIVTDSEKVRANQRFVEESLLMDHPIDCPVCDQAGECWLQDYYFLYGQHERRADLRPFTSRRKDVGKHVTLFTDRCVMCSRCVRFTREISGTGELAVVDRGSHAEIDVFPGHPCDNKLSGNVVDLCPVGALCSKEFLYQQRAWWLKSHNSTCTRCSTGCSIVVEENKNRVYRLRPRYNPNANDWWMCDIGRYEFDYLDRADRLVGVEQREYGKLRPADWSTVLPAIRNAFRETTERHGTGSVAAVLSPFLTCEEAFLLATLVREVDAEAVLALGPVPTEGEDDVYPEGFTIRAERCPNRRGIEAVIGHFQPGEVVTFDRLATQVKSGAIQAVFLTGGYPQRWITAEEAEPFEPIDLFVVVDLLPSPAAEVADYVLPGTGFVEKDGSYVNHAGLLQTTEAAVRPPGACHVEGQVFQDLLGRPGLYRADDVRRELADRIAFFAPAAAEVPEYGILLPEPQATKRPKTTQPGTTWQSIPSARPRHVPAGAEE
jgi:NADH-quinone oxidoreductase subunit G